MDSRLYSPGLKGFDVALYQGMIPDEQADLDWFDRSWNPSDPDPDGFDQRQIWKAPEIH